MSKPKEFLLADKSDKFLDLTILARLLKLALPYRLLVSFAFVALVLSQIIPFAFPHLLGKIIDGPVSKGDLSEAIPLVLIFLALVIGNACLYYFSNVISKLLALRIIHDLRVRLYKRVTIYSMTFFHRTPIGRLMTRMTNDVDTLNSLFAEGLLDLLSALLMIIFAVGFMLVKDWRLALTTLTIFPVMVIVTSIFRVKVRNINRIIRSHLADLNATLQENLNGILIVQIFNQQQRRYALFKKNNKAYRDAYITNVKYYSYFFPALFTFSDFSLILCYSVGSYLILQDSTTVGSLVAFAWYANMFNRPLREISDKITQLQSALAAGERVLTLMDTDALEEQGSTPFQKNGYNIEFKGVHFGYLPENPVLNGFDLTVQEGQSLAIVGATGAGKSTLFQLLNRFYTPQKGSLTIGGQNLELIAEEDLRQFIGNVSQDVYLFSDTVENNILLGAPKNEEKLAEVLQKSRVQAFVDKLPEGLQSVLNENGSNLSAGQRQLLSFARALYHDPQILLLDEATSAVDSETEYLIQQAFAEIIQNRTSIVIAHRLSTVVHSDQILVMHKGRMVEKGTHQELLSLKGHYHRLVQMNQWDMNG